MQQNLCAADISSAKEQLAASKWLEKFVTFSKDCDRTNVDDNATVYPNTKAPEKVNNVLSRTYSLSRFSEAEEIIEVNEILITTRDGLDVTNWRRLSHVVHPSRVRKCNQMHTICKKLKRINQLKQMDDLTSLCKEKMSISKKDVDKMDEDSD